MEDNPCPAKKQPIDAERKRRVMIALAHSSLNITRLAKKLGVSRPYVSDVINGRKRHWNAERRIEAALRVPPGSLFLIDD